MNWFGILVVVFVALRWAAQSWLEQLNASYVRAHADAIPEGLRAVVDPPTYAKSIEYTLAKSRFRKIELGYEAAVLLLILFTGLLPWVFGLFARALGDSPWAKGATLFGIGVVLSILDLPFAWWAQFRLEEKFGFNTSSQKIWWADRLKALCLGMLLGYPLLVLILWLVKWTGGSWWFWAWFVVMVFQLLMTILAPVLILPLFNKFTPLSEGSLRERLLKLAQRTAFRAQSIQVMDGSKRSRHSNAFFIGFGGFRKIVLFDTLIQQLPEPELEAVLAHEIGHFKRKHIPKMLAASALGSLAGFYLLGWVAKQAWFYQGFGFPADGPAPALLVFGLLSGVATFWLSPLMHWWSRRYEYEADKFAAQTLSESTPLIAALRKLNEKNLSNLTPHPIYSGFYYSHPTLLERERALLDA
jgi:STE24 endopeptidase